jgi:sec-independent protein translocase protein TatC
MEEADESTRRGSSMTYLGHLAELRKRLFRAVIALILASGLAFTWAESLGNFLMAPAEGMDFIYLSPPDLFMTYIKLALFIGMAASMPVILFQIWMFVTPALSGREKRAIFFSLLAGTVLFALGAAFAYFVIIPLTLKFFIGYQSDRVVPMLAITEYFRFVMNLALSFGAAFELPILAALLGTFGIIKAGVLVRGRRIAILLILIIAAIITPPDVVSQVLLAVPMLGLYEISVLILKIQEKRRVSPPA